jgi:hypothetical protein
MRFELILKAEVEILQALPVEQRPNRAALVTERWEVLAGAGLDRPGAFR